MADCSGLVTNAQLIDAGKDTDTLSDVVESSSSSTTSKSGKQIRTLQGINDAADNLISSLGGVDIGDYSSNLTLNSYNEYVVFDRAGATTGPSLWKAMPPRTPIPGTPLPYTIDSATYPDPTSDSNIEPFSDINKEGAEQIAQEQANAGDGKLSGGSIYPTDATASVSTSPPNNNVPVGAEILNDATYGRFIFSPITYGTVTVWDPQNGNATIDGNPVKLTGLNYQVQVVSDFASRTFPVGSTLNTKGYYSPNDGGGGKYFVRPTGFPLNMDSGGLIHHTDAAGNIIELLFDKELNYLQAGGKGDWDKAALSGTDNTPILENAISYLNPFEWQGSVAATNAVLRTFRAAISIPTPQTRYMLGDVVKLNPNTSIIGVPVIRTFGMDLFNDTKLGSFFVPNFGATKQTKYVFDAAPFNSVGTRITSTTIAITNTNLDNAEYTAVDGVRIENILVCPDVALHDNNTGDIHFSPLRLVGSSHRVKNNYWSQTVHGPSFQACWDYDYDGNLAQTFDSALSIFEGTVGNIGGINYCNSIGDRIRYGNVLPPWWVDVDAMTFVTGDFDVPSSLVIRDVTSGRVEIGTWVQEKYNRSYLGQNASFFVGMAHSESINESLMALRGCNAEFSAGKTFLPSNRLFKPIGRFGGGSKVTFSQFDFGCTGPLASYVENDVEINLMQGCIATDAADATPNQGLIQTTPYTIRNDGQGTPTVYYEAFDRRPIREIFSNISGSGLGSDSYYGFDDNSALLTLEGALNRVFKDQNVSVKLRNGSSTTTTETFSTTPILSDTTVNIELRFNNRTHTATGVTSLDNSKIRFGNGMIFTGASAFQIEGDTTVRMTGDSIINISSTVFSIASGKAAVLTLIKSDSASFNSSGAFNIDANVMSVNFINSSSSTVEPAGGWGTNTKVIS
jgi:hypothetical protein